MFCFFAGNATSCDVAGYMCLAKHNCKCGYIHIKIKEIYIFGYSVLVGYDVASMKYHIPTFPSDYSVTRRLTQKERNSQIHRREDLKTRNYKCNFKRNFVQGYSKELNKLSSHNWKADSKHFH